MKKLLILCALITGTAFGQGVRYDSNVTTSATNVPPGAKANVMTQPFAQITVCAYPASGSPCINTVPIYSDAGLTVPISPQPLIADAQGRFGFWVLGGTYAYSVQDAVGNVVGNYVVSVSAGGSPCATTDQAYQFGHNSSFNCGTIVQAAAGNPTLTAGMNYSNTGMSRVVRDGSNAIPFSGDIYSSYSGCHQDVVINLGNGNHYCTWEEHTSFAPGLNAGAPVFNDVNNGLWSGNRIHLHTYTNFTPGINQLYSGFFYANAEGDSASIYFYHWVKGGWVDKSGEGATAIKTAGGQGLNVFAALSTVAGTGLSSIATTQSGLSVPGGTQIDQGPLVDGFLLNLTHPIVSGQFTGFTAPGNPGSNIVGHLISNTAVPVDTGEGQTTTNIVVNTNIPAGNSATVTVTNTLGTFSGSSLILFACEDFPDFVTNATVSAPSGGTQNITGNFLHSHLAGCRVYQGQLTGSIIDLIADQLNNGYFKTDILVAGSANGTNVDYRIYETGQQATTIQPNVHNFGFTNITFSGLVRTANVTKWCDPVGTAQFSGQYITLTGAGSTYNVANVLASGADINGCISWANSGANGTDPGGTIASGGTVGGMLGLGAYNIYPAARIQSVGYNVVPIAGTTQTKNQFNGTLNLYPNSLTVAVNDVLLNPDDIELKISPLSAWDNYESAPTGGTQEHVSLVTSGHGVVNDTFHAIHWENQAPWEIYTGGFPTFGGIPMGSGQKLGPTGIYMSGPAKYLFRAENAPLPGGYVRRIGANPGIKAGYIGSGYFIDQMDLADGSPGWSHTFNPVTSAYAWSVRNMANAQCGFSVVPGTWTYNCTNVLVPTVAVSTNDTHAASTAAVNAVMPISVSLTTTAATSDVVTVTGMTAGGHCSNAPTNASGATNYATTYVSAKTTNQITVTHVATAGMTYDFLCTAF